MSKRKYQRLTPLLAHKDDNNQEEAFDEENRYDKDEEGYSKDKDQPSESTPTSDPENTMDHSQQEFFEKQTAMVKQMKKRISQLETLVSTQAVEMQKLKQECEDLNSAVVSFSQVFQVLRQAGLSMDDSNMVGRKTTNNGGINEFDDDDTSPFEMDNSNLPLSKRIPEFESFEDADLFGSAPNSVMDAADSAGASILAAMLAGKFRMMVDVRDAELSTDPDILVQFIELAILPVAAGLEGLTDKGNRVKVVFPTVNKLLEYRKAMSLSSPDVIALSVLGFGSVEEKDNLVVLVAPSPDDEESMKMMWELLDPTNPAKCLKQPVVVVNHHMLPLSGPTEQFEVVYHLRLLSVQYMTGSPIPEHMKRNEKVVESFSRPAKGSSENPDKRNKAEGDSFNSTKGSTSIEAEKSGDATSNKNTKTSGKKVSEKKKLEKAMDHAHDANINQGFTRAMVIRAYPRPWHVFVDTSPDADADFEVAATFDEEPSTDDINFAIVECLEGSEREDELVAQQMQQALESGQLDKVSQMLEISMGGVKEEVEDDASDDDNDDDMRDDNDSFFGCDST